jgi:hypothetical protein
MATVSSRFSTAETVRLKLDVRNIGLSRVQTRVNQHTDMPPAAWDVDGFAWPLYKLERLGQWEVVPLCPRIHIGEPAATKDEAAHVISHGHALAADQK